MLYRFENKEQLFALDRNDVAIIPVKELAKAIPDMGCTVWAEIPAIVYPGDEGKLRDNLTALKEQGIADVLCDNIGAIEIARELGLNAHGGLFLNIMNEDAIRVYRDLGLKDFIWSMETPFAEIRKMIDPAIPGAIAVYGYMPLMKFRACPKKAANGDSCKGCSGLSELTDRLGKKFPLICRERKYSELLNCVPLYAADKSLPKNTELLIYFTKESKIEAEYISDLVKDRKSCDFEKTGGLYGRELL
jgi:putative protease